MLADSSYYYKDEPRGRKTYKRTKWGPIDAPTIPGMAFIPKIIPANLTIEQIETLNLRIRIEEIGKKLQANDLDIDYAADRSPSPTPVYDNHGKRLNTLEQRVKDILEEERTKLIQYAGAIFPAFKPPVDFTPASQKRFRKIYIPIEDHPEYNFIGLIIGPRGNTQKRMEKETGCKIAIRGRGSVKEGKLRKEGRSQPGEDEDLHVLITGDTDAQVDKAAKMIDQLLVPIDEGKNEWKRKQLRELAEINGTLRDRLWKDADKPLVKCKWCGESSHPAVDCPIRGKEALPTDAETLLEKEYQKFLREIGETGDRAKDAYEEFMRAIGEKSDAPPPVQQPAPQQFIPPPPFPFMPPFMGFPGQQAYPTPQGGFPGQQPQ